MRVLRNDMRSGGCGKLNSKSPKGRFCRNRSFFSLVLCFFPDKASPVNFFGRDSEGTLSNFPRGGARKNVGQVTGVGQGRKSRVERNG